ncbi:MAG TPA: hypothetical protein VFO79_15525, partial [Xanthomonadales bacterium]|nr:hypothetical protein [Xanthomonadales bacterium]
MKWLKRFAIVLLVLLVAAAGFAWFTFGTERGARFTFDRIVALTDGKLSIGAIAGRLPGALTLTDLRYRDPAAGVDVTIERLVIDVGVTAALSRRALIESLDAQGVAVKLTTVASDPPNESPWQPPLDFIVERASIERLTITRDGEPLPRFDRIELAGSWTDAGIAVRRFDARGPDGRLDLSGEFASARGHRGKARGTFAWRIGGRPWAGELDATSDGRNARATVALRAPMAAAVRLTAVPSDDALPWTLALDAPPFDPAVIGIGACRDPAGAGAGEADAACEPQRIESISAKLEGSGNRERFALTGDLTLDEHRVRLERFEGTVRDGVLALHALRVSSPDAAGALDATGALAYAAEPSRAKLELAWHD